MHAGGGVETLLDEIEKEMNRVLMVDDYDLSAKRVANHELTIFILNKIPALRAALQSVKVEAKQTYVTRGKFGGSTGNTEGWLYNFTAVDLTKEKAEAIRNLLTGKPPGESA